ncbi:uncharacterized protein LOC134274165, partial [Saccostrea cucullata]|uniref:uncharacterized protein LOC134274165 n=1 Tax=Saccostrea cuccullata TaxID=36930 RepID=UPI002ECFAE81
MWVLTGYYGIINSICSPEQMGNESLQSSTLELNNSTINIIWAQADFSELYNVLQKVKEMKKNSADLVYVNSTNHRIIMTISNLNTTPTLHLNDVDQESVESLVAPEKYPYCHEVKPKLHNTPTEACLSIKFGENYFDEETLSVMVARILTHLHWKSTITFFENATAHNVGKILERVNEIGVNHRTYNVDSLKDAEEIRGVLDLIHSEFTEGMANITLVCQLNCTRRVLNE